MIRIVLLLLLLPFAAIAQTGQGPMSGTATVCPPSSLTGCTIAGPLTTPAATITTTTAPAQGMGMLTLNGTWSCAAGSDPNFCSGVWENINVTGFTGSGGEQLNFWKSTLNFTGTTTGVYQGNAFEVWIPSTVTTAYEVNAIHGYVNNSGTIGAGVGNSEVFEASLDNSGSIAGTWYQYYSIYNNLAVGTVTGGIIGMRFLYTNANTTANSISSWEGIQCDGFQNGGGTIAKGEYCLVNNDKNAEIQTQGHLAFRKAASQPVLSACGTSPSLDTYGSDTTGVITEGATATGCTMTFNVSFVFAGNSFTPHCIVVPYNGSPTPTAITVTTSALTITNTSGSGYQYGYFCTGSL